MKQFDVDVAVVGGGPGGLAAAAAIGSAFGTDTTVKIYESLKKYTLQGSGVLMMPNVQNALEAIQPSLLQKFIANGVRGGGKIYDTDDKLLMTIPPGMTGNIEALSEKYGKAPFFLGWHEIRHLLYESLPAGVVEFDKQMKSYEETEDGVTLHFDHGQPPVHARLVVGADGYFSKVRTQCLNDGPPDFVGSVMWRARIGWQEGMENPVDGPSRVYGKPGPMNINKQFAILFKMGTLEETKTSQRHISHSPSPSQSPEGMEMMQIDGTGGVKGNFAGGVGFGVTPYADAEALSKLRGHPAWETQEQQRATADAPGGLPYGQLAALEELDVSALNAFLDSVDSAGRAEWGPPLSAVAAPLWVGGHHLPQQWPPYSAVSDNGHGTQQHAAHPWAGPHSAVDAFSDSSGHYSMQQ
ncbi:MAG: Zeaxanthin epoxidase [Trebouxia sp. A1-2]|nr:MAG: Zeaxanthin epoxidase [Trebouxia sp. A1-2]